MTGTLALVGGDPFVDDGTLNRTLLEAAGATEVVLLPTAAAFEGPGKAVEVATAYFAGLGVGVRSVPVLGRADAMAQTNADTLRDATVIYLIGSAAMHARPTLQETPVWEAIVDAWSAGATVIGSDAGAKVLCDPMVDDRGGAFTVGLGLIKRVAVVTRLETWSPEGLHRLRQMTNDDLVVIGLGSSAAVIRSPEGRWTAAGSGTVEVHVGSELVALADVLR